MRRSIAPEAFTSGDGPIGGENTQHLERQLADWRVFGSLLGISELKLRSDEEAKRAEKIGGEPGCGWIKCPTYRISYSVEGRELMACSGCRKVRYR